MSMLKNAIDREKTRNINMIIEYQKELEQLPKGKITPKKVNGNIYYYLYYRDGNKVISKYIGKDSESLKEIEIQLERRSQIEVILKQLKKEKEKILKLEALL